ncbi:MAG: HEPN domain-containing protein [Cyclobacteriaceae bacterium]|nr:HEPN domain-containing protein [Cyclobacteriaceae bacterium]
MKSFRTELEDPVVEKDILELEKKIRQFHDLEIDEEKFRSLRLARGIYGQRQPGVQMVRIKIPYGKLTAHQLKIIADIADEYASGTLHATTRQDIQIHYVSLDRTPELWTKLEQSKITLREACGNTVRNVTASPIAGIDPEEAFDVSPYAQATFEYFLRNPVCQDMGRKFKISFSSSDSDSAMSFIHDLGFIPKIRIMGNRKIRGFKVLIGGGLGAQPFLAQIATEFLEEDRLIPFIESVLRVFDRYGERARRHKARIKFLLADIGLEELLSLARKEETALKTRKFEIDKDIQYADIPGKKFPPADPVDPVKYALWLKTNVISQKQPGYSAVFIKVPLGNITSDTARKLADVALEFAADDIRITINQGYLFKYIRKSALPHLFNALADLELAEPGFDSTTDITACPGTDTCNLGISSSTGVARVLEKMIIEEYPQLITNTDLKIKISGCPNSCGQHGIAGIGFHGSSIKKDGQVLPAVQVLLGGGILTDGNGKIAEKVIKILSKRAPIGLRLLLDDYLTNKNDHEKYMEYYERQSKNYFYQLLKPLNNLDSVESSEFIDWDRQKSFELHTGVGECAGVIIDLVSTLFFEAEEKLEWARENFESGKYADSIYHAYNTFIHTAKAMLLTRDVTCNSQISMIRQFDENFDFQEITGLTASFASTVLKINENEPGREFAKQYIHESEYFLNAIKSLRQEEVSEFKTPQNEPVR